MNFNASSQCNDFKEDAPDGWATFINVCHDPFLHWSNHVWSKTFYSGPHVLYMRWINPECTQDAVARKEKALKVMRCGK